MSAQEVTDRRTELRHPRLRRALRACLSVVVGVTVWFGLSIAGLYSPWGLQWSYACGFKNPPDHFEDGLYLYFRPSGWWNWSVKVYGRSGLVNPSGDPQTITADQIAKAYVLSDELKDRADIPKPEQIVELIRDIGSNGPAAVATWVRKYPEYKRAGTGLQGQGSGVVDDQTFGMQAYFARGAVFVVLLLPFVAASILATMCYTGRLRVWRRLPENVQTRPRNIGWVESGAPTDEAARIRNDHGRSHIP